ncbi:MAG: hypothetical protein QM703_20000 [Gemmatales bacterium]
MLIDELGKRALDGSNDNDVFIRSFHVELTALAGFILGLRGCAALPADIDAAAGYAAIAATAPFQRITTTAEGIASASTLSANSRGRTATTAATQA